MAEQKAGVDVLAALKERVELGADCVNPKWVEIHDAVAELIEALHEGRRAIGDHHAPNDCYATGPLTGDSFRDLVQCPACSFIAMYDAAIARCGGA